MEIVIDESGDAGTLNLDGELTIQNAEALKMVLLDALERVQSCRLDVNSLTRLDLPAVQLIYSACLSFENAGKHIELAEGANDIFKKGVEAAGYSWKKWLCFGQV